MAGSRLRGSGVEVGPVVAVDTPAPHGRHAAPTDEWSVLLSYAAALFAGRSQPVPPELAKTGRALPDPEAAADAMLVRLRERGIIPASMPRSFFMQRAGLFARNFRAICNFVLERADCDLVLVRRGGLRARILEGGRVRQGDVVVPVETGG